MGDLVSVLLENNRNDDVQNEHIFNNEEAIKVDRGPPILFDIGHLDVRIVGCGHGVEKLEVGVSEMVKEVIRDVLGQGGDISV